MKYLAGLDVGNKIPRGRAIEVFNSVIACNVLSFCCTSAVVFDQ